jgi:hypothetical protein
MMKCAAYGANILCERLATRNRSVLAKVVSSALHDIKKDMRIIYLEDDAEIIDLPGPQQRQVDVIWAQKIRAVIMED